MPIALIPLEGESRLRRIIYENKTGYMKISSGSLLYRENLLVLVEAKCNCPDGGQIEIFIPRLPNGQTFKAELHNQIIIPEDITPRIKLVGYDSDHIFLLVPKPQPNS